MNGQRRRDTKTLRGLVPSDVLVQPLKGATREAAIGELLNALVIHGVLDLERETGVREALLQRERVASTGIGNGLAIPHAKSKFAERLGVAVGLSEAGVDFEAHDGEPAHVVVLWICPPRATQEHLALMRGLATLAQDPKMTARLAKCKDRRGFLALVEQIPL
ncbi:MAG: PTS sugar transporter subunit IIA [Planctomycetota bacterium]|jgi:PTS system fructose-specific IIC component